MPQAVYPVALALDAFYAKPARALFHALEFAAYTRAGPRFADPVLDLGCGDGGGSVTLTDYAAAPASTAPAGTG